MQANANKRRQTLTNASKRRGENASKREQTWTNSNKRPHRPLLRFFTPPFAIPLVLANMPSFRFLYRRSIFCTLVPSSCGPGAPVFVPSFLLGVQHPPTPFGNHPCANPRQSQGCASWRETLLLGLRFPRPQTGPRTPICWKRGFRGPKTPISIRPHTGWKREFLVKKSPFLL